MITLTLFALSLSLLNTPKGYDLSAPISQQDSIPSQQSSLLSSHRFRIKCAPYTKSTLILRPSKNGSGNEFMLPIGFIEKSIRISSGEKILKVEEDYVYLPDRNRIRVLDETTLKSDQPLQITYERLSAITPMPIPRN